MTSKKVDTWNAKCPIFLGNFTPNTSNYCLKNRALGFPGSEKTFISFIVAQIGSMQLWKKGAQTFAR